jgi:hypothetical protein
VVQTLTVTKENGDHYCVLLVVECCWLAVRLAWRWVAYPVATGWRVRDPILLTKDETV